MEEAKIFQFEHYELNESTRELRHAGESVETKPQVLSLLAYMMRNRSRIVSRRELFEEIWADVSVSEGTLNNAIYEARTAIGDDGHQQRTIQTVHRKGFRFIADVDETDARGTTHGRNVWDERVPFIGRKKLLEAVRTEITHSRRGHGRLILIDGEAGVGKTAFTQRLTAGVNNMTVRMGRCYEGKGAPPFWPWVQILLTQIQESSPTLLVEQMGHGVGSILQLLPSIAEKLPGVAAPAPLQSEGARFELFDALTKYIARIGNVEPLLLVIDDLHWADSASLRFLEYLSVELSSMRVCVIATYREEELNEEHPLVGILGSVLRHPHVHRHSLQGLEKGEVRELIEKIMDESPTMALSDTISKRSDGNPLFVRELLGLMQSGGSLESSDSVFSGRTIPKAVRELILRRISSLSGETQEMLSMASVIGREFDLGLLQAIESKADSRLLESVDDALAAHVIAPCREMARFRFRHALIQETLYEKLGNAQRAELHRAVCVALESSSNDQDTPNPAFCAHHALEAAALGDTGRVTEYSILAGDQAAELLAYEDAASHYSRAVESIEASSPIDHRRLCEILMRLGESNIRSGAFSTAEGVFLRAAAIARREKEPEWMARAALGYSDCSPAIDASVQNFFRKGSLQQSINLLEEALDLLGPEARSTRARLLGRLARDLNQQSADERAEELSQLALELAHRVGDPWTLADVVQFRRGVLWSPDQVEERLQLADELIGLAQEAADRSLELTGRVWRAIDLLELCRLSEVRTEVDHCQRIVVEVRQPRFRYIVTVLRGTIAFMEGRFADSEVLSKEALEMGARSQVGADAIYWVQMLALRREQGRLEELLELMTSIGSQLREIPALQVGVAYYFSELGDAGTARRIYEHLCTNEIDSMRRDRTWTITISVLSNICYSLRDRGRAQMFYDFLLPYIDRNIVAADGLTAVGAGSYFLGLMSSLLGRWEEALGHYDHALKLNQGIEARALSAQIHRAKAELYVDRAARGDGAIATILIDRTQTLAETFGQKALIRQMVSLREKAMLLPS